MKPYNDSIEAHEDQQEIINTLVSSLSNLLIWDDGNLPGDLIDEAKAAIAKATEGEQNGECPECGADIPAREMHLPCAECNTPAP